MLLSVITVVLNCVDTIERTIKSVLNQQIKDMEYIVIDGGSTDGTLDIIKKYSEQITYWVSEPDKGLYDAMNKGIKKSTGEWIAFMNADDWYEPAALSKFNIYVEKSLADIIYGKVNKIENDKKNGYLGIYQKTDPNEIYAGNMYCHQGLFIKKKLFDEIGLYDCQYRMLSDYDWLLKASDKGIVPEFADFCVANFTMGGLSCSRMATYENRMLILRNYEKRIKTKQLERIVGKSAFEYFCVNDSSVFECIVQFGKQFYIWGTGMYGNLSYELITRLNCEVIGFVDSNASENTYRNKEVYLPTELFQCEDFRDNADVLICVATEKYENEIISILDENEVPKSKYVTIGEFFDVALREYIKPL